MKRAIVPIPIKSINTKINSYNELHKLFIENTNEYAALVKSGDAHRMSFSFSKELPCKNNLDLVSEGYLCYTLDPFMQSKKIKLFFGSYHSSTSFVLEDLKLFGGHKHKTKIMFTGTNVDVCSHLSIFDLLIQDFVFTIKKGAKLRLKALMLDSINIIVEDGGILELIDVEFSNNIRECVHIKTGGIIALYENVRFFDVYKKFKIDYASLQTTGKLIDFTNSTSILNFMDDSTVSKIELIGDFIIDTKNIILSQDIEFVNISTEYYTIKTPEILTNHSLVFNGNFEVLSDIHLENSDNISLSLGLCKGHVNIDSCDHIKIHNTHFEGTLGLGTFIKSSAVSFYHCFFINITSPIQIGDSSVVIENSKINNVNKLVEIKKIEMDEDTILLNNSLNKIDILISNSEINASLLLDSNLVDSLIIKNTKLENSSKCLIIKNCPNIEITESSGLNNDYIGFFEQSNLNIQNCIIDGGIEAFNFINSKVKSLNSVYRNLSLAFASDSSDVYIDAVTFNNCDVGLSLGGERSRITHRKCDFRGCNSRQFIAKPGTEIINLEEEEEFKKCQIL